RRDGCSIRRTKRAQREASGMVGDVGRRDVRGSADAARATDGRWRRSRLRHRQLRDPVRGTDARRGGCAQMITPWDDYPVHQTAMPVATPVSGDPNHYDRYFFNGFDPNGEYYFGVALGIYPNRGVIDGAFSVVRSGVQHSVFA